MKRNSPEWRRLIETGAAALGVDLVPGQLDRFALHAETLAAWNRKVNLTAITEPAEVAVKHFVDSLAAVPLVPREAALLDLGAGGGFPGLPLKVALPALRVTLVDASRKKVSFLSQVIRLLALEDTAARHARAEAMADDPAFRGAFDVVVSRAVTAFEPLARLSTPLLRAGGILVAMRGPETEGGAAPTAPGVVRHAYRLPHSTSRRSLWVWRKP